MSMAITTVLGYLPPRIALAVNGLPENILKNADEIRLRKDAAASVTCGKKNFTFDKYGDICGLDKAVCASANELAECFSRLSDGSLYTCDKAIAKGYIPIPGGGRAGICGKAEVRKGVLTGFSEIYSVDLRIHRFIRDSATALIREYAADKVRGTVVVSPPAGGKTTFLRSAAFLLANGIGIDPLRVCVCDEREEIMAGMPPQRGLADVIYGAPKAEAMSIFTRTMAPQLLICDEISAEDCKAVLEAQNCGVPLLASAHGQGLDGLMKRPFMKELIGSGVFELCVTLERGEKPIIKSVEVTA